MGLVILGAMLLYLLIAIVVVKMAIGHARKNDKNALRWGLGAALIMYLIPFWDWIPTVVAHKYYCATEAGFTVYKTLDEWKKENPGVMDALVANESWPSQYEERNDGHEKIRTRLLNEKFEVIVSQKDIFFLLPVIRREEKLKDIKAGEVLAQYIGFAAGNSVKNTVGPPGPLKFWMSSAYCGGGRDMAIKSRLWMNKFKGAEK